MSDYQGTRCLQRRSVFETLESRLALSAQPMTDVELGVALRDDLANQIYAMSDDPQFQQVANIRQQYGFDGKGQTVAIIDSGIAWDHVALGGGYGAGHKVVGGWDFAENDANPYDDGPFGFHGTHVAGIVGNSDATRYGVASGVDLVALRVFNDNGVSDFNWVEQALRWIHEHKNDYANPITTVNLSVGTRTNLLSLPALANLADEFATLEADGIFISVAAGNAFQSYLTQGLTYPAVSPNVVPVSSHDATGDLSDFSQRADQVLVAPGRNILSTVPDHLFAGTQSNGFLSGTGTSMAAPYVAGASALLREAMEFMGTKQINQDLLYDHFRQTADRFFDPSTSRLYHRINIQAAIDAIVRDDHSDHAVSAARLGTIADRLNFSGTIGKHSDVDHLAFTAAHDGIVTLTVNSTHGLKPLLSIDGQSQQLLAKQITINVKAGQSYDVSVATSDSTGHYHGTLQLARSIESVSWGPVTQKVFDNLAIQGEQWFRFAASKSGLLTVEGLQVQGVNKLELYSDRMQWVGTATTWGNNLRLDRAALAGESFFLRVLGNTTQLDVRVTNLVSLGDGLLSINGTDQGERIALSIGPAMDLFINDVSYRFAGNDITRVEIDGGAGSDQIQVYGSQGDDRFRLDVGSLRVTSSQITVAAKSFENVFAVGRGGFDVGIVTDSLGDDAFVDAGGRSRMYGTGFDHYLLEFERTRALSKFGSDSAHLSDSAGVDRFIGQANTSTLRSIGRAIIVDQFTRVVVRADCGGLDTAELIGSAGDDQLRVSSGTTSFTCAAAQFQLAGFESITIDALGGNDSAELSDFVDLDHLWGDGSSYGMRQLFGNLRGVNFDNLWASAMSGAKPKCEMNAVDYYFRLVGDWQ